MRAVPREISAPEALESLVQAALKVARTALRNHNSLAGDNFYANKLIELRAEATNIFQDLSARTAGDTSAMAEMIEGVFSPGTSRRDRAAISRELIFSLRTTWRKQPAPGLEEKNLFPPSILAETKRGYLSSIGRQMNGCYSAEWYDAAAVMMRRLLEVSIIEAFEAQSLAHKITGADGNYVQLSDLIGRALSETSWKLSRNTRNLLPQLRDLGHRSAHGRYYNAKRDDVAGVREGCRVAIEEFLHHAKLL